MAWKHIFTLLVVLIGIGSSIYHALRPVYSGENFFVIPLSQPNAPINDLYRRYEPLRLVWIRTLVSVDAYGRLYIMGSKDKKAVIIVITPDGRIQQVFYPLLKGHKFIRYPAYFCVSPSGNRIWTVCFDFGRKVTVHNKEGIALTEWQGAWRVDFLCALGEEVAYTVGMERKIVCYTIGKKIPEMLDIPTLFPFFKSNKFWFIGPLESIIGRPEQQKREDWVGVATWAPKEGYKLVRKFKSPFGMYQAIQWIDNDGNFYVFPGMTKWLLTISPEGKLLRKFFIPSIVFPAKGEKIEYGQLIKADETGIYIEVERVSEPREYRIVRIVKKKRWQVWLEGLKAWMSGQ